MLLFLSSWVLCHRVQELALASSRMRGCMEEDGGAQPGARAARTSQRE